MRDKIVYAIVAISMLLGFSILTRGHEWGDDFASYIMQARSILDGDTRGFVEHNAFTIFESSIQIGPVAYPWGYPLILAPAYALKGLHPLALKLPSLIFYGGFLFIIYLLTKNRLTRTESLLFVSLFAFNPMLIRYHDQILSDIPFLFFSTLALFLFALKRDSTPYDRILLSLVIAGAFFIRTQGVLLLLSYMAGKFFNWTIYRSNKQSANKNLKDIFYVIAGFGVLWALYTLTFPGGNESYFSQYSAFRVENVLNFIYLYFQVFGLFLGEGNIWVYLYYAMFVFFLIGTWVRRKEDTVFIIYFSLWMLLLITWPYWQGPRFIFPLLPIFIYFTFWGMKTVIARLPGRLQGNGQLAFVAFWLVISGVFLTTSISQAYVNLRNGRAINGPFDAFSTEMFDFIKEETPPESIIIFFKPRAMRLFTERDSIMVLECERLPAGDYVAIHKKWDNSQIQPQDIGECGIPLENVFENRRFIVYKILKSDT